MTAAEQLQVFRASFWCGDSVYVVAPNLAAASILAESESLGARRLVKVDLVGDVQAVAGRRGDPIWRRAKDS